MTGSHAINTLILAGGRGQRFDNVDKGLLLLNNKPLVQHVAEKAAGTNIIVSANRNIKNYEALGFSCWPDTDQDYAGPMMAILSAAKKLPSGYMAVLPCDVPFIPKNIITTLVNALEDENLNAAYASCEGKGHYCCAAFSVTALTEIQSAKSMYALMQQLNAKPIAFKATADFLNINTADDLQLAQNRLSS